MLERAAGLATVGAMKMDERGDGLDRRVFLGAAAGALAWGCGREAVRDSGAAPAAATAGSGAGTAARPAQIRIGQNENPYGPSPAALAAVRDAVAETYRYTDFEGELLAKIAARHGVTAEHVILGTGSYGVLIAAVAAVVERGTETIVPHPVYAAVERHAKTLGPVARVSLDRALRHDLDATAAAIRPATRLVYVCNPNNPTGTVVPSADLRAFCRRHAERVTIIVDEAYAEYVPDFSSMDALVRDGAPILVTRTFSKLYGLAGLRIGYAIAPPKLAAAVRSARGVDDLCWVSRAGTRAAIASLDDGSHVASIQREVGRERARLVSALERHGLTVPAPAANFVFFKHRRPEAVKAALAARGVLISAHDPSGGCRISIGLPSDMSAAIEALGAVLPSLA